MENQKNTAKNDQVLFYPNCSVDGEEECLTDFLVELPERKNIQEEISFAFEDKDFIANQNKIIDYINENGEDVYTENVKKAGLSLAMLNDFIAQHKGLIQEI